MDDRPVCDLHVETTGNDTTQVVCCTIYSHLPTDTTADGEWMWDELIGLLNDECLRVCNSARAEQGRAWRNPELLYPNNLRDAVLADYDLIAQYDYLMEQDRRQADKIGADDTIGEELFDQWLPAIVKGMMEMNRPQYGAGQ